MAQAQQMDGTVERGKTGRGAEGMKTISPWEPWATLLDNPRPCPECRDTGTVLSHRPMIYETDDADEIADAYRMASRKCPSCAKRENAIAKLRALLRENL